MVIVEIDDNCKKKEVTEIMNYIIENIPVVGDSPILTGSNVKGISVERLEKF